MPMKWDPKQFHNGTSYETVLLVPYNNSNIALLCSCLQRAYSLTVISLTSPIL